VRVLVTGANGFVGGRLVRRLRARGVEVVAGYGPGSGAGAGAAAADDAQVRWVELEITNPQSVRNFVAVPCDALIHLAGIASVREANQTPGQAWAVNALGTAYVTEALARSRDTSGRDPVMIFASSAEVYEPQAGRAHLETDRVGPTTPYAASKLGGELAALSWWRGAGVRAMVVRPFPHIGAGQAPTFWVAQRSRVLLEAKRRNATAVPVGDLSPIRDFLHVEDVVDAYLGLLEHGRAGEVYNIASGRPIALEEVHAKLEHVIGVHPLHERAPEEVRTDARPYLVGDASKLRAATGWIPRRSLEQVLEEVVDAQTG